MNFVIKNLLNVLRAIFNAAILRMVPSISRYLYWRSWARSGGWPVLSHPQTCLISYIYKKRPKCEPFQSEGTTMNLRSEEWPLWASRAAAVTGRQSRAQAALPQLPALATLVGRHTVLLSGATRVWANQALNGMESWTVWLFHCLIMCPFVFSYRGNE